MKKDQFKRGISGKEFLFIGAGVVLVSVLPIVLLVNLNDFSTFSHGVRKDVLPVECELGTISGLNTGWMHDGKAQERYIPFIDITMLRDRGDVAGELVVLFKDGRGDLAGKPFAIKIYKGEIQGGKAGSIECRGDTGFESEPFMNQYLYDESNPWTFVLESRIYGKDKRFVYKGEIARAIKAEDE